MGADSQSDIDIAMYVLAPEQTTFSVFSYLFLV